MQKFTEREHVTLTGIKNWFIAALVFIMALPSAAYSQKLRVGTLYIGREERSSINHRWVLGAQLETLARRFTKYPIR